MKTALGGIKVVDFSWVALGPTAGRYLADHGATVVRVESKANPDVIRMAPPFKGGLISPDMSGYSANYNCNKYGMTLDLNNSAGKEIALRLAKWADIILESFTPGTMAKFGLDYETVRAVNPDIIYASTTQCGQTGTWSTFRGFGGQGAYLAGFGETAGYPDDEPLGPFGAYTDFVAHRYMIIAILSALFQRQDTGNGQYIDVSQVEASIHFLSVPILDYCLNGRVIRRSGNKETNAAPHNVYRCRGEDRWCAIAVHTEIDWLSFCTALGKPLWSGAPKFGTLQQRKENEEELDRLVESWTSERTPEEVMDLLQKAGVPAGLVARAEDLHRDPQFKHRGHYWVLNHSAMGPHTYDAPGFRLSETPAQPKMPAPCLGEHNHFVCTHLLGMGDQDFVGYDQAGAFG